MDTSLLRARNFLYGCKLGTNRNHQFTVGNLESECQWSLRTVDLVGGAKEELCLVQTEAMDYEVKATLATLKLPVSASS